jgi:hypothetical protein
MLGFKGFFLMKSPTLFILLISPSSFNLRMVREELAVETVEITDCF